MPTHTVYLLTLFDFSDVFHGVAAFSPRALFPQLSGLSIMVLLGYDCHCSILR